MVSIAADLTADDAGLTVVAAAVGGLGGLDGVVHAAGIFDPRPLSNGGLEVLDRHLQVNVRAPYGLTLAAIEHLIGGAL